MTNKICLCDAAYPCCFNTKPSDDRPEDAVLVMLFLHWRALERCTAHILVESATCNAINYSKSSVGQCVWFFSLFFFLILHTPAHFSATPSRHPAEIQSCNNVGKSVCTILQAKKDSGDPCRFSISLRVWPCFSSCRSRPGIYCLSLQKHQIFWLPMHCFLLFLCDVVFSILT